MRHHVVLAVCFLAAPWSAGAGVAQAADLTLTVTPTTRSAVLGEPVYLKLVYRNETGEAVRVPPLWRWTRYEQRLLTTPVDLMCLNERGEWVDMPLFRASEPYRVSGYGDYEPSYGPPWAVLEPGESLEAWWLVTTDRGYLMPGRYRARVGRWGTANRFTGLGDDTYRVDFELRQPEGRAKELWGTSKPSQRLADAPWPQTRGTVYAPWSLWFTFANLLGWVTEWQTQYHVANAWWLDNLDRLAHDAEFADFPMRERARLMWDLFGRYSRLESQTPEFCQAERAALPAIARLRDPALVDWLAQRWAVRESEVADVLTEAKPQWRRDLLVRWGYPWYAKPAAERKVPHAKG